jgi:hypothetical protein
MDTSEPNQYDEQIQLLDRLSTSFRSGATPERLEVDEALERGFGRLIGLEAELQRARGNGSAPDESLSPVADLEHSIAVLSCALTELRTLSSPPGSPRIGYGFVLPAHGRRSR